MSPSDRRSAGTGNKPSPHCSDALRSRSIRFADSEWKLIEQATLRHGITAGELIRTGALALAEVRLGEAPPATMTSSHLALFEVTYRTSFETATLETERLIDSGHERDVDALVNASRKTMAKTMKDGPA